MVDYKWLSIVIRSLADVAREEGAVELRSKDVEDYFVLAADAIDTLSGALETFSSILLNPQNESVLEQLHVPEEDQEKLIALLTSFAKKS